jgi:hypothetical protein
MIFTFFVILFLVGMSIALFVLSRIGEDTMDFDAFVDSIKHLPDSEQQELIDAWFRNRGKRKSNKKHHDK